MVSYLISLKKSSVNFRSYFPVNFLAVYPYGNVTGDEPRKHSERAYFVNISDVRSRRAFGKIRAVPEREKRFTRLRFYVSLWPNDTR